MGHNLMVVPYAVANPQTLTDNFRIFRDGRTARGFATEPEILAVYHFYCGETAEKAKNEPREAMLRYLAAAAESNRQPAYSQQYQGYGHLQQGFKAMMDYEGTLYPDRVIFGDPEQCIERIRQIRSIGVTNVGLLANFGGMPHQQVMASIDRFARHVMPRC